MWAESGGGAEKEKKELDGPNGTAESPNNATAQHVPNQPRSISPPTSYNPCPERWLTQTHKKKMASACLLPQITTIIVCRGKTIYACP